MSDRDEIEYRERDEEAVPRIARRETERHASPLPTMHTSPTSQFGAAVTSTALGSVGDPSGSASR